MRTQHRLTFVDPTRSECSIQPVEGMLPVHFRRGESQIVSIEPEQAAMLDQDPAWECVAVKATDAPNSDAPSTEAAPEPASTSRRRRGSEEE